MRGVPIIDTHLDVGHRRQLRAAHLRRDHRARTVREAEAVEQPVQLHIVQQPGATCVGPREECLQPRLLRQLRG